MTHPLLGRSILLITAHPDDEAFLAGGLAYVNTQHGGKTSLICATLGERGTSHLRQPKTAKQLKAIRRRELMRCCHLKGIRTIRLLKYPDGDLKRYEKSFAKQVDIFIRNLRPDIIVTFGPDGFTGHEDHITCWRVGRQLARKYGRPLFLFTTPPSVRGSMVRWIGHRRAMGRYVRKMRPYALATVRVPVPTGIKIKILHNHPSQFDYDNPYTGFPKAAVALFTRGEYFTRYYPTTRVTQKKR